MIKWSKPFSYSINKRTKSYNDILSAKDVNSQHSESLVAIFTYYVQIS